ncbi:MAG: hypothetical protein LUO82_05110 [Methanomicrobiales archaeon]|nr:hypothetical protein [Methanomicrobiales archaeon]
METLVGRITHYFPKVGVAVVHLMADLNNGDQIRITGAYSNFSQPVTSMQVNHQPIVSALKGQEIGVKVSQQVREGDMVYRISG